MERTEIEKFLSEASFWIKIEEWKGTRPNLYLKRIRYRVDKLDDFLIKSMIFDEEKFTCELGNHISKTHGLKI